MAHNLLGTTHNDTTSDDPTRGSIVYGNSSSNWDELVLGAAKTHLESDGTDISWEADITMADDAWIGLGSSAGRLVFDDTPDPDCLDIRDADFRVRREGAVTPSIYLDLYSDDEDRGGMLCFRKSHTNTLDNHAATLTGERLGRIEFQGNDGAGFDTAATITVCQEGALSGTGDYIPAEIWIQVASTQSYMGDAQFGISKQGCFGIGDDDPSHHIDVFRDTDDPCDFGSSDVMIRLRNGTAPDTLSKSWLIGIDHSENAFIIRDDIEGSVPFTIEEDAPTNSLKIQDNGDIYFGRGKVGIGVSTPQGYLHEYGDYSGILHWEYTGLDDTIRTVLPDGAGDVSRILYASTMTAAITAGDETAGICWLTPGDSIAIYDDEVDIVVLAVAANGAVTVYRATGEDAFTVSLWLMWI